MDSDAKRLAMAMAQTSSKSAGIAWFLNLFLIGVGNIYAGGGGGLVIGLIGLTLEACLVAFSVLSVGLGLIVTIPLWFLLWIVFSIAAGSRIKKLNVLAVQRAFEK